MILRIGDLIMQFGYLSSDLSLDWVPSNVS